MLNSQVGPDLSFFDAPLGIDQAATPDFVPGRIGNALTIGPGTYANQYRYHNVVVANLPSLLDAERGTIEVWYKQNNHPVSYAHEPYRIFDGSYGLSSGLGIQMLSNGTGGSRLHFSLSFGGSNVIAMSPADGQPGYDYSSHSGSWTHLRGTWDRAGIDGSPETLRLYVNGRCVARATGIGWGTVIGSSADIGGCNDSQPTNQFAVDDLRIWNGARGDRAGSGEDFVMETLVNGLGDPAHGHKSTVAGNLISVSFRSPGGFFDGTVPLLIAQTFPTGSWLATSAYYPALRMDILQLVLIFDGQVASPVGPWLLPPCGITANFFVPMWLEGTTVRFQALVASSNAANLFFASTDAHDFQID
ncbi:MAG: hypothetical protein KDB53_02170 [Planctomycetes bacterium]|nr:hypothetical protein [Planctomycetota bacterium]